MISFTVLPYYRITSINSRGNCPFFTFFLRELLEGGNYQRYQKCISCSSPVILSLHNKCIIEAFPDRFLISLFYFLSFETVFQTILCEFLYCRSKIYENNLPSTVYQYSFAQFPMRELLEVIRYLLLKSCKNLKNRGSEAVFILVVVLLKHFSPSFISMTSISTQQNMLLFPQLHKISNTRQAAFNVCTSFQTFLITRGKK